MTAVTKPKLVFRLASHTPQDKDDAPLVGALAELLVHDALLGPKRLRLRDRSACPERPKSRLRVVK